MNPNDILQKLTTEEKAALCSGEGSWYTKANSRLGIPSLHMTDGPCGVRNPQKGYTDPATCFPAPCMLACSFDPELLSRVGSAIGEECVAIGVQLLLAPGVNLKRSPLGGRNFEYFSEDPLLSGSCAAGYIRGVQSQGVGAVLKHFALNNQENWRLVSNSVADEATMRELYLRAFEIAIRDAKPAAVMTSYNRVNDVYASESFDLLTGILRNEWGFDGLVISDWGAVNDRVSGLRAGMDLEMPGSASVNDPKISEAVKSGKLPAQVLDTSVLRILRTVESLCPKTLADSGFDIQKHHDLARQAAVESAVLLENNGVLPLHTTPAIIGRFAKEPHFQGGGSAHVNPTMQDSFFSICQQNGPTPLYAPGWDNTLSPKENHALEEQAIELARRCDTVVLFLGTEASEESEGFDRKDFQLGESQQRLAKAVIAANPNTVVVVQAGGVVDFACAEGAAAILYTYLSGQAGGAAIYDLLFGAASPSGKLPESFPLHIQDTPCHRSFGLRDTVYYEKTSVGYRYYNSENIPVRWPFGHGLSYSKFELSQIQVHVHSNEITVSGVLKNIGSVHAAQTIQIYAAAPNQKVFSLCAFCKQKLLPGEAQTFSISFDIKQLAHFDEQNRHFVLPSGNCSVQVGFSSRDICYETKLPCTEWSGSTLSTHLAAKSNALPTDSFHANSTVEDLLGTAIGKMLFDKLCKELDEERQRGEIDDNFYYMYLSQLRQYPLRTFVLATHGNFSWEMLERLLALLHQPNPDLAEAEQLLKTIRVL